MKGKETFLQKKKKKNPSQTITVFQSTKFKSNMDAEVSTFAGSPQQSHSQQTVLTEPRHAVCSVTPEGH